MSTAPESNSMTPCESIADHLYLIAGGDCEAEVLEQGRAHLAECETCSERLRQIQRLRQVYFESAHRSSGDRLAEEHPDLWPGLKSKLEVEGLLRPAVRPVATTEAVPGVASQPGAASVVGGGGQAAVLQGRFGDAMASPNTGRAVAGLLAGAAAGLLIFGLGADREPDVDPQPIGASASGHVAENKGSFQIEDRAADLAAETSGPGDPLSPGPGRTNVLDADALNQELTRISDEAWLASAQPSLRTVTPSEPDPAEYIQDRLPEPSLGAVPYGNGLVGSPLRLKIQAFDSTPTSDLSAPGGKGLPVQPLPLKVH